MINNTEYWYQKQNKAVRFKFNLKKLITRHGHVTVSSQRMQDHSGAKPAN